MKRWIIILAAVASATAAAAQNNQSGGLIMDKDLLMPSDFFELSQTQFNFGTARAMAMAGAFTSLGADLSSMSINPAGLGMYRHNDISFTPMMSFVRSDTNADPYGRNHRDRFAMANVGGVANLYEGSGKLISVSFGFGYNRIADLKELCAKKGLDFEAENAKYLAAKKEADEKQAEKDKKKAEKAAAKKAKQEARAESKEAKRVAALKAKCEKQGLDFEAENKKYFDALAEKKAKKADEEAAWREKELQKYRAFRSWMGD